METYKDRNCAGTETCLSSTCNLISLWAKTCTISKRGRKQDSQGGNNLKPQAFIPYCASLTKRQPLLKVVLQDQFCLEIKTVGMARNKTPRSLLRHAFES